MEQPTRADSVAAAALFEAFVDFDADDSLSLAVLTGAGGYFCAGADLKALAEGDRRAVSDDGPGPMGPTRLALGKPVIAAIEGPAVAGGLADIGTGSDTGGKGGFPSSTGWPSIAR